jgi:hypothetical protein
MIHIVAGCPMHFSAKFQGIFRFFPAAAGTVIGEGRICLRILSCKSGGNAWAVTARNAEETRSGHKDITKNRYGFTLGGFYGIGAYHTLFYQSLARGLGFFMKIPGEHKVTVHSMGARAIFSAHAEEPSCSNHAGISYASC